MNRKINLFLLGTLALAVAIVVGVIWPPSGWGVLLVIAGVVSFVAWLIMFFQILSALNSDI